MANAVEMVNRCFRAQNPDLFGGELIQVPDTGIRQTEESFDHPHQESLVEDFMGNGERLMWDQAHFG